MEQNQVNEGLSKDELRNELKNDVARLKARVEKLESERKKLTKINTVEKSLVAAAGITGGAALLSPILGPTAATIGALTVAVTYIFLNVNKTLPKPEQESDSTDDSNA